MSEIDRIQLRLRLKSVSELADALEEELVELRSAGVALKIDVLTPLREIAADARRLVDRLEG